MKDIHPVLQTGDGFFNTLSLKKVSLYDLDPDMIEMVDIANALSMICRFNGQIERHYSVGQHSLFVMNLAKKAGESLQTQKAALLHDAAEAYLGDVIKPLKVALGEAYKVFEDRFEKVIFNKYQVSEAHLAKIKKYDQEAVIEEHRVLLLDVNVKHVDFNPTMIATPEIIRDIFFNTYQSLEDQLRKEVQHEND